MTRYHRIKYNRILTPLAVGIVMLLVPSLGAVLLALTIAGNRELSRGYAFPLGMLYGTIGHNIFCRFEPDLVRYLQAVRNARGKSLGFILSHDAESLYVRDLLYYLVSRTDDEYILPFIIGIIDYTIIFYVLLDMANHYDMFKARNGKLFIVMLGFASVGVISAFTVIGNLRCITSFIIITFAVYRDTVQNKKNLLTLFFYLFPLTLHTAAVIMLVLRILVLFVTRYSKRWVKYVIPVVLFTPNLVQLLYSVFGSISNPILRNFLAKAYFYFNWKSGGFADEVYTMYISPWIDLIFAVPYLALILCYTLRLLKNRQRLSEKNRDMTKMIAYYLFDEIVMMGAMTTILGGYPRFQAVTSLFLPVMIIPYVSQNRGHVSKPLLFLLLAAMAKFTFNVMLFCRWVHMDQFFVGFMTTCPAYLLLKLLVCNL